MARRSQLREGGTGAGSQSRLSVSEQEQALQSWAKANGHIIDSDTFEARHREQGFRRGQEHEVIFVATPAGKRVIKRNYNRTVGPLAMNRDYAEYLDRIALHNDTFPDSAVRLEGFMEMSQGLAPVISQKFIESDGTTLSRDIAFHHYAVKASLGGVPSYVRLVVRELNDGSVHYDTDTTTAEVLDENGEPTDQPDRKPSAGEDTAGFAKN